MKKVLFASLASLALVTAPALAADMAYKSSPMAAPVANWTGCYINGGGGYSMSNDRHYGEATGALGIPTTSTTDAGGQGWLGRVGGGCDWQTAAFGYGVVLGVLADYDFGGPRGTFEGSVPFGGSAVVGNTRQDDAWAVGGRAGILVTPNLLTYFSVGYTEARFNQINLVRSTNGTTFGGGVGLAGTTFKGWFLGSGTEYTIASFPGLYWRNEYRYSSFDSHDRLGINTTTLAPVAISERSRMDTQSITTSLVYKFNSWR